MSPDEVPLPRTPVTQYSLSEPAESLGVERRLETAFAKYVQVWLWSILVGAATSETVSFLGVIGPKWGPAGIGLVAISFTGALAALAALLLLARFFGGYLLPVFFGEVEPAAAELRTAANRLKQSLNLIIFALAMRMLLAVAELALTTVLGAFRD